MATEVKLTLPPDSFNLIKGILQFFGGSISKDDLMSVAKANGWLKDESLEDPHAWDQWLTGVSDLMSRRMSN